jgi:hypothetical protein
VSETSSHENNARVEAVTAPEMTHPVLTSSVSLPLAFPEDPEVYGRENDRVCGYEWMIGDSLLAAPLYGDDYKTVASRDIYLPHGTWIDYDAGTSYDGPLILKKLSDAGRGLLGSMGRDVGRTIRSLEERQYVRRHYSGADHRHQPDDRRTAAPGGNGLVDWPGVRERLDY